MLNAFSLEQLLAWSEQPGLLPRVPAGPHRKRPWNELSDDALSAFARDRDVDVRYSASEEMRRRLGMGEVAAQVAVQRSLL